MRAMTLTSAPTSPPVPAVHAKLERERARLRASELGAAKETADNGKPRLALMHAPGEPSTPTFEARMNEHGAQREFPVLARSPKCERSRRPSRPSRQKSPRTPSVRDVRGWSSPQSIVPTRWRRRWRR